MLHLLPLLKLELGKKKKIRIKVQENKAASLRL